MEMNNMDDQRTTLDNYIIEQSTYLSNLGGDYLIW